MIIRLAWRNIWRNKRRSIIIMISIVIGVTAIEVTDSLTRGLLFSMFENQVGQHTGHIQIHKTGYRDDRVIENYISNPPDIRTLMSLSEDIKIVSERTISYGLVNSPTNSTGTTIIGVNPQNEMQTTTIYRSIVEGTYLTGKKNEAVISKKLSEILDSGIGDKIVMMTTSAGGTIGTEMFRIVGLYKTINSSFDRMNVYIHKNDAAAMLRVKASIAEMVVIIKNIDSVNAAQAKLRDHLGSGYEVITYREVLPNLIAQLEMTENSMLIFYFIIGLAMVFGIVNMMLMSVFERINEFGVLKAIGMKNGILFRLILTESFFIGLLGSLFGSLIGTGVNSIWMKTGLDFSTFSEGLAEYGMAAVVYPIISEWGVVQAFIVILTVSIVAALYPAYRATKLEPISAIRYI